MPKKQPIKYEDWLNEREIIEIRDTLEDNYDSLDKYGTLTAFMDKPLWIDSILISAYDEYLGGFSDEN